MNGILKLRPGRKMRLYLPNTVMTATVPCCTVTKLINKIASITTIITTKGIIDSINFDLFENIQTMHEFWVQIPKGKDMSVKMTLDMVAMQEDFFADTVLIGIASALPGHRFCWLINKHFEMDFIRDPEQNVCLQLKQNKECYFPIYKYELPLSNVMHLLYKLKNNTESLLPEAKQLDYIWLIQTTSPDTDAYGITQTLRNIPEVQLAQLLEPEKLKNLKNLIV